ncbi:hypothetical protein V502_09533 [Pseudogymnoascus sp. VKM F-4520 (FW-2644)]|nr:hypothetical protein V502_09533 [Pseudogymnoascus sp. VKM F-4520 (FW-2644)]
MSSSRPHTHCLNVEAVVVITCSALSSYNALELILITFSTFKKWTGLYFWSLLVASFGILPYNIGFLIFYFELAHNWVGFIFSSYGWATMVTGQSVVLYSRLHLVTAEANVLKPIKWMIIVNALVFHIPITVMLFASHIGTDMAQFVAVYKVYEKIQMTGFCIQEFVISGVYLREAVRLIVSLAKSKARRTMWQLFSINIIIIVMDIFLLVLEYRNLDTMEQTTKGLIYSIKLKLEFAILGKLVDTAHPTNHDVSATVVDTSDFLDAARTTSEVHAVGTMTGASGTNLSVEVVEDTAVDYYGPRSKSDVRPTSSTREVEQKRDVFRSITRASDGESVREDKAQSQEYAEFIRKISR